MRLLAVLFSFVLALAGCATFQTPNSSQAVAEQGLIQFGVIKELQDTAKKDPEKAKQLATSARAVIVQANALLNSPDVGAMTFAILQANVTKVIAAQHFDAATLVAIGTVRELVDTQFNDIITNTALAPGGLTPDEVKAIRTVLSKIDQAITMIGY